MVWNLFETLTDAAIVMQKGAIRRVAGEKDWLEVIHRDLRPENVFFDEPGNLRYPRYARPVLGDFGSAMQTSDQDRFNPAWYLENGDTLTVIGKAGYQAPETRYDQGHLGDDTDDITKIMAHTNVWGIGMTMISFMDLHVEGCVADDDRAAENRHPVVYSQEAKEFYSKELQDMVARCTRLKPAERPDPSELRDEILFHATRLDGPSNGMRNAPAIAKDPNQPSDVEQGEDRYALGLSIDQLPLLGGSDKGTEQEKPRHDEGENGQVYDKGTEQEKSGHDEGENDQVHDGDHDGRPPHARGPAMPTAPPRSGIREPEFSRLQYFIDTVVRLTSSASLHIKPSA